MLLEPSGPPSGGAFAVAVVGDRLVVTGEVDLATAPALRSAVTDAVHAGIRVLDLRGVTYFDCAGAAVIHDHAVDDLDLLATAGTLPDRILTLLGLPTAGTLHRRPGAPEASGRPCAPPAR